MFSFPLLARHIFEARCLCQISGVGKDGLIRHFFHRPSKAYTTGTRKRRKVHTDEQGGETRWHKTGKTRPVFTNGKLKGYKKILVLYTNYGKQRKPEKTNWVMHQYHLGSDEEEKDGELVVSKVFYQTQPRQCGSGSATTAKDVVPLAASAATTMDHHHHHRGGGQRPKPRSPLLYKSASPPFPLLTTSPLSSPATSRGKLLQLLLALAERLS